MFCYHRCMENKYKDIKKVPRLKAAIRRRYSAVLVSTDTVGKRINMARTHKNISQTELAKSIGTIYQRIHEWESDWKNPSYKYLEKIAAVLDVSAEWLRTGIKTEEPRFIYDQSYPSVITPINNEQFENRKDSLLKSGDAIVSVSAETLESLAIVLERLKGIDFIIHVPSVIRNQEIRDMYFSSEKEEEFQRAWSYIKDKLDNKKHVKLSEDDSE